MHLEVAAAGKLGLCCESCNATQYGPFSAAGSWAYRYSLFVDDADSAKWLGDNSVESFPTFKFFLNSAEEDLPIVGADIGDVQAKLDELLAGERPGVAT